MQSCTLIERFVPSKAENYFQYCTHPRVSVQTEVTGNSFTTKKQMTKFLSANFPKMLSPRSILLRIQRLEGK